MPIAGKTVRTLVYDARAIGPIGGWLLYAVLPVLLTTAVALWFARSANRRLPAVEFARTALLINTWIYFALNFAFARFPWPWQAWTPRTPNTIIFFVCAIGLTAASLRTASRGRFSSVYNRIRDDSGYDSHPGRALAREEVE